MKSPVYLSGPITGKPNHNIEAFEQAESALRGEGHEVVNPITLHDTVGELPWSEYLREDIASMMGCRSIVLLPDWGGSRGARKEVEAALGLGFEFYRISDNGGVFEVSESQVEQMLASPLGGKKETILEEAQRHVYGDRNVDYGHPFDDFSRTGRMWGAILGMPDIPPEKIALCMATLKISREINRPKRDNRVDGAGYFATLQMVAERREENDNS